MTHCSRLPFLTIYPLQEPCCICGQESLRLTGWLNLWKMCACIFFGPDRNFHFSDRELLSDMQQAAINWIKNRQTRWGLYVPRPSTSQGNSVGNTRKSAGCCHNFPAFIWFSHSVSLRQCMKGSWQLTSKLCQLCISFSNCATFGFQISVHMCIYC